MHWEYKTIQYNKRNFFGGALKMDTGEFTDQLNKLGNDGWELVNVCPNPVGWQMQGVIMVFKRPR